MPSRKRRGSARGGSIDLIVGVHFVRDLRRQHTPTLLHLVEDRIRPLDFAATTARIPTWSMRVPGALVCISIIATACRRRCDSELTFRPPRTPSSVPTGPRPNGHVPTTARSRKAAAAAAAGPINNGTSPERALLLRRFPRHGRGRPEHRRGFRPAHQGSVRIALGPATVTAAAEPGPGLGAHALLGGPDKRDRYM